MSCTRCCSCCNGEPGLLEHTRSNCRNLSIATFCGIVFFTGWWFIIDVQVTNSQYFNGAYHLCGVFGTLSLFMVNSVSSSLIREEGYGGGCMGPRGARAWLFLGFLMGFAATIAACWILFANFVAASTPEKTIPHWPGIGLFLQNSFIFIASLVYKFGRAEEQW